MYQVGDLIVYENAGVCQVMELTASENCPALSCMPKGRLYYILHPLFGGGTIYTPADPPKAFMRPVISRREAEELISLIPKLKADPYYTQNLQDLREHYKAAASSHSCKDLIQLTMSVYKKKGRRHRPGKTGRPGGSEIHAPGGKPAFRRAGGGPGHRPGGGSGLYRSAAEGGPGRTPGGSAGQGFHKLSPGKPAAKNPGRKRCEKPLPAGAFMLFFRFYRFRLSFAAIL